MCAKARSPSRPSRSLAGTSAGSMVRCASSRQWIQPPTELAAVLPRSNQQRLLLLHNHLFSHPIRMARQYPVPVPQLPSQRRELWWLSGSGPVRLGAIFRLLGQSWGGKSMTMVAPEDYLREKACDGIGCCGRPRQRPGAFSQPLEQRLGRSMTL